jgi:cytidine deaminase
MTDPAGSDLRAAALAAAGRAYAPYSGLAVGVAARTTDGRVLTGCNVENASYGLTLCAECGLVSALALAGGGRLAEVICVSGAGAPLAPCGRCRQLLWEHAAEGCTVNGTRLDALLPGAFGRQDLP